MEKTRNLLELLEEIRSIAQLGLNYTKDKYDKERYEKLLKIACYEYSNISGLDENSIIERFKKDLGHVTPKVGVEAAIFGREGKILLVKRSDDKFWSLPCGWTEVCETPQDAIMREVIEETGLIIEVKKLIDVFSLMPGKFGQPHTLYHMMYYCEIVGGNFSPTDEVLEVAYYNYKDAINWHNDHRDLAEKAFQFWNAAKNPPIIKFNYPSL